MTFRDPKRAIEAEGVNYVRSIVERHKCIFQVIDTRNDQGNDAFVEFVVDDMATNLGAYFQIKSGCSYKDKTGYKIPSDRQHLLYWSEGLYPMLGVVYDPDLGKAFWVDIKKYIEGKPEKLENKTHTIRVPASQEFNTVSFEALHDQFIGEIKQYKNSEKFGRSLEWFAAINEPETCYEGFKSLYANYRDRKSTWFYILSSFRHIDEEGIRRNILGVLSNYLDNPFILWSWVRYQEFQTGEIRQCIKEAINQCFGMEEVVLCLPYLREGIYVGSFSYLVYHVISQMDDLHLYLKELAFKPGQDPDDRNFYFWLYLHTAKHYSISETIETAEKYLDQYPDGYLDEAVMGTIESIKERDLTPVGKF